MKYNLDLFSLNDIKKKRFDLIYLSKIKYKNRYLKKKKK